MKRFWIFLVTSSACLLAVLLNSPVARSQQSACAPADVAVNAILPDGKLIRGLKADNLVAETKAGKVQIESVTRDTGPRRILFVLDVGHDLPRDARRAQAEIASYIISGADPADSFALITARGARSTVRFGEGRDKLAASLAQIEQPPKNSGIEFGSLDALTEALDWFQAPQPGDAIVLMASDFEENKSASYSKVAQALADRHIRVFGYLLGPINLGTMYAEIGSDFRGRPSARTTAVTNDENLSALSWDSGGYMIVEKTKMEWKEYKLTDAHLDELKLEASHLYGAATEFYRVAILPPAHSGEREQWKLDLSDSARKRVPQAKILFPRQLPACLPLQTNK
jgi:hypothetical protein